GVGAALPLAALGLPIAGLELRAAMHGGAAIAGGGGVGYIVLAGGRAPAGPAAAAIGGSAVEGRSPVPSPPATAVPSARAIARGCVYTTIVVGRAAGVIVHAGVGFLALLIDRRRWHAGGQKQEGRNYRPPYQSSPQTHDSSRTNHDLP